MKKSNVIIFALLALISIFLLWLWYYLGFNKIDEPLDLVLTIIWWVMIAAVIVVIVRIEKERRRRIRTVYVSDDIVFNSEAGTMPYEDQVQLVSIIDTILNELKYNFTKEDLPNKNAFPIKLIIRTEKHKDDEWEGEVANALTKQTTPFKNKEELFQILNEL